MPTSGNTKCGFSLNQEGPNNAEPGKIDGQQKGRGLSTGHAIESNMNTVGTKKFYLEPQEHRF